MMRLVRQGLMFGNLIEVSAPALVERYKRALKHLTGLETKLDDFHIDISGYSPEIGDELGDEYYLNPHGCNQQFILLTPDQKTAPLLSTRFSTSRSILRSYIQENEDELFALTAQEAVAGELMNSIFAVKQPGDLFQFGRVEVEADTIEQHVAEASSLRELIDTFTHKKDAWWDDVLIAEMIELAKRTGNIELNPVKLKSQTYTQENFYTSFYGGLYIFRGGAQSAVIAREKFDGLEDMDADLIFTFEDRLEIAKYLIENNMAERIDPNKTDAAAAILRQKLDFIIISAASESGENLDGLNRQQIRRLAVRYGDKLPDAFNGVSESWRWATGDTSKPRLSPSDPAYFYVRRAEAAHPDRDLINMMLADLSPLDFRQLFICHKEAFYEAYQTWSETKKEYVCEFLVEEYAIDKAGARETLFGPEPSMFESLGDHGDGHTDIPAGKFLSPAAAEKPGPWGPRKTKGKR